MSRMDWAFNKCKEGLLPVEAIPSRLLEIVRLSLLYGSGVAEQRYMCDDYGYTEEAMMKHDWFVLGFAFRIREIYYDAAHGIGSLAGLNTTGQKGGVR